MHSRSTPVSNRFLFSLLVALGLACLTSNGGGNHSAWAQQGPAVVRVEAAVLRERMSPTQSSVGTVEPTRTAVVGSAVDGRVTEIYVREGDRVEKDQPLARLLTETIELELEAATAELEQKKQELQELENGSRSEELAQTLARLEASRIAADYLNRERDRVKALFERSALSAAEFEDSVSLALEAEQRLAEARAAHDLAVAGPRSERIAQARAEVAMRDAVCRRLQDQIKKHTLYSRFAGYLTAEFSEVGQWLARGEPVAEIVALDQVDVVVKVLESHIPFSHLGDVVEVEIPALKGKKFMGEIVAVIPQADVRSRTFPVKIRLQNKISERGEPLLKAGMLARAVLPISETGKAVLVPKDALVLKGDAAFVWTIVASTIEQASGNQRIAEAIPVPVITGESENDWIAISGDISAGSWVVTRGNERIIPSRPGQPPAKVSWMQTEPVAAADARQ